MELTILNNTNQALAETYISNFANPRTKVPYRLALKRFYEFLNEQNIDSLNDVTLEVAQEFVEYLNDKEYSAKTINMTVTTVRDFYKWLKVRSDNINNQLVANGMQPTNWINLEILELQNIKVDLREQKTEALTEHEAHKLLKAAYNYPDKFQSNQFKIMLLIMINAGLRVQELTQLKLSNFKMNNGYFVLNIQGKGMRKRLISLAIPVTNELNKIFRECNFSQDHYIIQGHDLAGNADPTKEITPANIWKRIKKIADNAKLDKDISPHSLRRTCATIMYSKNVPIETIQRILGHDNPHTTQRYIDMQIDIKVSAEHALNLVPGK